MSHQRHRLDNRANAILDRAARVRVTVVGRPRSAFRLCGAVGLVLSVALAMGIVHARGLSPAVMAVLVTAACATFLLLALAQKVAFGEERLVYYHHEIAVILVTAGILAAWGRPVLPYLDATILGVGVFLACGRVGCLMVGCCHGKPHSWGIRYGREHAADGLPSHYVGVRLFPIQAVESVWAVAVVAAGTFTVLTGRPAGAALALYVTAYGVGRFLFELARGDAARAYWHGLSQAQLLSLGTAAGVVVAEGLGQLPWQAWHAAAATALLGATATVWLRRRRREIFAALLDTRHEHEILSLLERAPQPSEVACTSLGLRLAAGAVTLASGPVAHYSLSGRDEPLDERLARGIAGLIVRARHPAMPARVIRGDGGVHHVLVGESEPREQAAAHARAGP